MSRGQGGDQGKSRRARAADWTSLGVSIFIVLLLIGLVVYQYVERGRQHAIVEVGPQLESVREAGGVYYLPVEVTNQGDDTAEAVKVSLSMQTASGQESANFQINFLAGGATETGVVTFSEDPSQGGLTIDPVSYVRP